MARLNSEMGRSSRFRVDFALLPPTLLGGTGGLTADLGFCGAAPEASFASNLPISRAASRGDKALKRASSAGLFASWYMISGPFSLVKRAWLTAWDTGTSDAESTTSSKSGCWVRASVMRR